MSYSDPVASLLAIIKNGQAARLSSVESPHSKERAAILEVLKNEGYIRDFRLEETKKNILRIVIELKYFEGKPAIKQMRRVSKPGRRVYRGITDLPKFYNGLGISILSTSKGIMSDYDARIANVGGEVICNVF